MGRIKGKTSYTSNFEPLITGPIDARLTITGGKSAVFDINTWKADDTGALYIYNGMLTAVWDSAKKEDNGIYILTDAKAFTDAAAEDNKTVFWLQVPTTAYVELAIRNASVDLSPYATISWVNSTFVTKTGLNSTLLNYATHSWTNSNFYTKSEVDTKISTVYKFKGSVDGLSALLALENGLVGDAYNVVSGFSHGGKPYPAGTNVVCVTAFTGAANNTADKWDPLGGTVDLSIYQLKAPFTGKKLVYDGPLAIQLNVESVFIDIKLVNADNGETTSKALTIPKVTSTMPGLMPKEYVSRLTRVLTLFTSIDIDASNAYLHFAGIDVTTGTALNSLISHTIPAASSTTAGLMTKANYNKLAGIQYILTKTGSVDYTTSGVILNFERYDANIAGLASTDNTFTIGYATRSTAGVMIAADKAKLDNINNYYDDITGITPDAGGITITFRAYSPSNNESYSPSIYIPTAAQSGNVFNAGLYGQGLPLFDIYRAADADGSLRTFNSLEEIELGSGLTLGQLGPNSNVRGITLGIDPTYIRNTSLAGLSVPTTALVINAGDTILGGIGKLQGSINVVKNSYDSLLANIQGVEFGVRGLNAITGTTITTDMLSVYDGSDTLSFGPQFYKTVTTGSAGTAITILLKLAGVILTGLVIPSTTTDVTATDDLLSAIGKLQRHSTRLRLMFTARMYSNEDPSTATIRTDAVFTRDNSADTFQFDDTNFIVKKATFSNGSNGFMMSINTIDCGTY